MDNWEEAAIAALKAYWHPDDPAYTNWQMDIFLAGYRAALAAREAEVGRLEIERGVFAAWATREVIDAKDAMHILKVDEDQFRELVNTSAKRLVELMGEQAALADHTP